MLDTGTKAKIDSARDILVGKVPDPKSQVEQITIALIYKFMDDMDRQSEELGGKASFFTGEFKKYRWAQLLDKRFSGHERLLLYAEGIEKMNVNKNIPQLFRDIFKGVFLPYRDPETLNLFLKEINGFAYDHSEQLGNAYEYLLSILGTQGDAGQFRTPRHIIDFIVAVVDPQKNETVLDPACGTAGFLISAFKHILKKNENLTPDERARLMTNFRGYDIAPDMVRLSRVNMYLHGFPNPVIHEYDTLTSEERWDERCDVIMANPPFMTPKGGIRPHNRFSIKAKRSEVLFVDYIAEHLNPGGRAGVIVPEGIIFQSQNAYKDLRRMLVKDFLWAVVSLPAGVFNPYSGVKTSVLFLDRNLARRTDEILFAKVENDGFDLGAQRRPIGGSQLPEALRILEHFKKTPKTQEGKMALTVPRKRLLESQDLSFSGDRYRVVVARPEGKWPMVRLGQVCDAILSGGTPSTTIAEYWNGSIPWITSADIVDIKTAVPRRFITRKAIDNSATSLIPAGNVIVVTRVGLGKLFQNSFEVCISQDSQGLVIDKTKVMPEYLVFVLAHGVQEFKQTSQGSTIQGVTRTQLTQLEFPLPPLNEQERIVAELEGYRKVIEGARQILASYKPTIRIDPTWPAVTLSHVCEGITDGDHQPPPKSTSGVPFITITNIDDNHQIDFTKTFFVAYSYYENLSDLRKPRRGDILYTVTGSYGIPALVQSDLHFCFQRHIGLIRPSEKLEPRFLACVLASPFVTIQADKAATGAAQKTVALSSLRNFTVPLPPLDAQRQIVADLEAERKLVEANRELIARMEAKIKAKLAEVWGEDGQACGVQPG